MIRRDDRSWSHHMTVPPPPPSPAAQHPAGWYPDPAGRFHHRWWDGAQWTEHVSTNGVTSVDAQHGPSAHVDLSGSLDNQSPERITQQVARAGAATGWGGGGTLFTEPVLVVNQKAKIIEVTNQYAVFDQHGRQLGSVNQVGQSTAKKVMRVLTSLDQFMTHRLEVRDHGGQLQLSLTRPAKVFKSTVVVSDPSGGEIGRIVQENMIGKIHFGLEANGQRVGAIHAENWRAWNFRIEDHTGTEVARITKTWEGLARTMFTTADNYVVQFRHQLPAPLLQLVVASALSVDTALKQDQRGLG
jgi:uncharacterized protein YxjI